MLMFRDLSPGDLVLVQGRGYQSWYFLLEDSWYDFSNQAFIMRSQWTLDDCFTTAAILHMKLDELK